MRNGYVLATEPVSAFRANALCQNDTMSQPTINTASAAASSKSIVEILRRATYVTSISVKLTALPIAMTTTSK
jgi:hypothetical protein